MRGTVLADFRMRGHLAREDKDKGKHNTLDKTDQQLNDYCEAPGNPPLLVAYNFARSEAHTNLISTQGTTPRGPMFIPPPICR